MRKKNFKQLKFKKIKTKKNFKKKFNQILKKKYTTIPNFITNVRQQKNTF
jgi:hypothetical protein